jgi:hypothetical protein
MAKVLNVDGTDYELKDTDLVTLQKVVGGYIEALNLGGGKYLIVNEEGRMMRLPINKRASEIYGRDLIVGNAVICSKKEL